jgi:myo-inositol-1(or 4)-monophosphatase
MWEKEINIARQAAKEAGTILNMMFGQVNQIKKKSEIDLVTEADLQSEKIILRVISRNFPHDSILTEEGGGHNHHSERVWIVDPLDGTTNFAHTYPLFAISIALEFRRELVLGLVYNPYTDEHFEAVKGKGAFFNQKPIKVSQTKKLQDALLATGFPYDVHENPQRVMELFQRMIVLAQGVRRPGSAAIDLCYVAAGQFDGFWEERLKPWDAAAGALIVDEAGGKLTTYEGNPYTPYLNSIVAANPFIHKAMVEALNP